MKILKKLPKWAIVAFALVLIVFMASTLVQHFVVKNRADEQRNRIKQQQQEFFQDYSVPDAPDIWD